MNKLAGAGFRTLAQIRRLLELAQGYSVLAQHRAAVVAALQRMRAA